MITFREGAAVRDHTDGGALFLPTTWASTAPGIAIQDLEARDSNAAPGNTKGMEAISANLFREDSEGKVCSEAPPGRGPSRPAPSIQFSGVVGTSTPWIQLTGGDYARRV
jgi:hypothetical protein